MRVAPLPMPPWAHHPIPRSPVLPRTSSTGHFKSSPKPSLSPCLYCQYRLIHNRLTMSSSGFTQAEHKLLVIPGPIEVSDAVLLANASASVSHMSAGFVEIFKETLTMLLELLYTTPKSQAFVLSGSGTLSWDIVSANLIEPGERALVLNHGYFGDAFRDCLETYGVKVDTIQAELGHAVTVEQLEKHLETAGPATYKLVTITHCDTSTGVLADVQALAKVAKRCAPDTLVILDAVCSVASEEIRFDDWCLDAVLTASQKGLGTPPGLCIMVVSEKALKTFESRQSPPGSYYASLKKWLPIMKAYQSGSPAYFATPPTNLITALHKSLKTILESPNLSLKERFERHKQSAKKVRQAAERLGLKQIPVNEACSAHGMTAIYLPDQIRPGDVVSKMIVKDLVIAGGLHKDCKDRYVRIGHMGLTAVDHERGDVDRIVKGLTESLEELGHS